MSTFTMGIFARHNDLMKQVGFTLPNWFTNAENVEEIRYDQALDELKELFKKASIPRLALF